MTPDPETLDTNVWRCAHKKSVSVTKKVLKYAAYSIGSVVATVLAVYGAIGIWNVTEPFFEKVWNDAANVALTILGPIRSFADVVAGSIASLPWYITYGVGGILGIAIAIYGYSLLWCMARELTEEDWRSSEANAFAFAIAIAFAIDPVDKITIWYYVFRFVGAYYHYRKRVNGE